MLSTIPDRMTDYLKHTYCSGTAAHNTQDSLGIRSRENSEKRVSTQMKSNLNSPYNAKETSFR